jgi:leucyl aminopeptidase
LAFSYQEFLGVPALAAYGEAWLTSTIAENLLLADYEFTHYKSKKKDSALKEICLTEVNSKEARSGLARGEKVAMAMNEARDLGNTSALDLTPAVFASAAKKMFTGLPVTVKVLGEAELKKLKMNLLLAVGQGSKNGARLIVAEYYGKDKKSAPIVLIGKGVTYDTGGLNVKPSGSMHEMHLDMMGGASVLGALKAAASLKLKQNIIALVPAAENAVSDSAMRAGDIVTAMNGKTVEILHTDAEGRLILADALTYAKRYKAKSIIDVATLTGAALAALGQHASAILTTDKALSDTLVAQGEESGDLVWPLPLWDEYKQYLKSSRADVSNISTSFSRFGGTIEGAVFLSHFAPKDTPWVHIDIAPRMDSIASDKLAKGATGEPVRLLVKYLESTI